MKVFNNFINILETLLKILVFILFISLLFVVTLQVFSRFILPKTPPWTEEMSRFIFIWLVSLAAPIALKNNGFVYIDIFISRLPKSSHKTVFIFINVLTTILFFIFTFEARKFMQIGFFQTAPSMPYLKMYIPFMSVCVSGVFMIIFNIYNFFKLLKNNEINKNGI